MHDAHKDQILTAVLDQIRRDRDGNEINLENLKTTLQSYVDMGLELPKSIKVADGFAWVGDKNLFVYETSFEQKFLEVT